MSLSEIRITQDLKKRKLLFKMFVRKGNIFDNLKNNRIFGKGDIFKCDKLMICIGDILCDFVSIDGMKWLIQLDVDMKIVIFLKSDKLIIRHELIFDFYESLEACINPFHSSFILVDLCGLAECIFDSFFKFREGKERSVHLLQCSNIS